MSLEHVLNYLKRKHLENPSFSYALEQEDGGNIFWADPTCISNYAHFGDTLVFDTTYTRTNPQLPLAAFTGFNHHGQPLLFGCALLLNQSQSSLSWLFHSWLQSMSSSPPPPSITLEPDPVIHLAASQVFPNSRLRFSLPLITEKLAHVFRSHPGFEPEFLRCVSATETVGEFEGAWESVVRRYCLEDDYWIQSVYNVREQWVPVFIKDTFFGELCHENSFFDGFVDASTTLETVMTRCEEAVNSWRVKELRADYESANTAPVLKTGSPMEKQAAGVYTRAAFMKFQEEFVEIPVSKMSDSTYRVQGHTVEFESVEEVKASCSCRMFEYKGIVCRHVLAVFSARNVFTLPSRYLLRRWSKEARSSGEFSNSSCQESLTVCYENLRQEATKYVEEGAKSIQVYKAAVVALDEAAKKVAAAASSKTRGGGTNGDSYRSEEAHEAANGMNHPGVNELQCQGEKERTILELTAELERTGQRCEVYRANLLSVLRDMEEHKFQLSLKVQNARLSLKE
ncbi:MULE transposase domain-containing protein [Hirschfeldia incana]|nr:MULE transposase domain-containing protein [Hirschfeldia incana]